MQGVSKKIETLFRQGLKRCPTCDKIKPLTDFYKNKSRRDGHDSWCKDCNKTYGKKYHQEHPEKSKEQQKRWKQEHPKYKKKYNKKWNQEHPEYFRKYHQSPKGQYIGFRARARREGLPYCSKKEFLSWDENVPRKCAYCDLPEELIPLSHIIAEIRNMKCGRKVLKSTRLQIDRRIPKKGYLLPNLCRACLVCNFLKSNNFTAEETRDFAQRWIKPQWQKLNKNPI